VTRRLVSSNFPYVPITLTIGSVSVSADALIDTGFEGAVVVPPSFIPPNTTPSFEHRWILADDSDVRVSVYRGTVALGHLGTFSATIAAIGSAVLIGRRLTDRFQVILERGQRVIVES
jgi:predicted aspartyl protease